MAATVKQFIKRALSEVAKLKKYLQNCSGASRVSSSQYNTCSALQRSSQGVQPWNPEQTPLTTEWASWRPSNPEKKLTIHVRKLCCSRAPRGCLTESATGSRQCYSLHCSLVHGSGRLFPTPYRTRQTCQRDKATRQPRQTK